MTICVAAICGNNTVIGAADRMLTTGDTEYQQGTSKIWDISNSIVIMVAGDTSLQAQIYYSIYRTVGERIRTDKELWWTISEVANLYVSEYSRLRNEIASTAILSPLGLSIHDYLNSPLGEKLATELLNFKMPDVSAIITGIDPTGPHIYTVSNVFTNTVDVSCHDMTGFACVGSGHWHATSQFMFAGHSKEVIQTKGLATTYSAKKRAEVAPGIGDQTDMFVIGPTLGSLIRIVPENIEGLDKIYKRYERQGRKILTKLEKEVHRYVETAATRTQTQRPEESVPTEQPSAKNQTPAENSGKDA